MDEFESAAKAFLEAALPGAQLVYRSSQAHGEYDFDLHCSNSIHAAVEVTSVTNQSLRGMHAALDDKQKGGHHVNALKCKKYWHIIPVPGAKVNAIREKIDDYLSHLEQDGIERFYCVTEARIPSVRNLCVDLQIMGGGAIEGPPGIYVSYPMGGGATGPSLVVKAAMNEANKIDIRAKLGRAKTNERHLVVYIDLLTNGLIWTALTSFDPPSQAVELPKEITHIWVLSHGEQLNEIICWHAEASKPWQSLRVAI